MSWTEVNLAGLADDMERVPEGEYTFALLAGAKYGQFDQNKIEVAAKIVDGESAARVMYFSYPDPAKQDWSPNALKRLESALKKDGAPAIEEGQDPTVYLNQETVVGTRFKAPVFHREYTSADGTEQKRAEIRLFKVRPAV
jgi:hypothetical protein